jgi:hypothetical protein
MALAYCGASSKGDRMPKEALKSNLGRKIDYEELKRKRADAKSKAWLRKRKKKQMREAEARAYKRKQGKRSR